LYEIDNKPRRRKQRSDIKGKTDRNKGDIFFGQFRETQTGQWGFGNQTNHNLMSCIKTEKKKKPGGRSKREGRIDALKALRQPESTQSECEW